MNNSTIKKGPQPMGKAVRWVDLGKGGKSPGLFDVGGVKHNTRAKPYDKPGPKLMSDQKSEEKKYPGVWSHRAQPRNPDDPHPIHRNVSNRDVKDLKSGKHVLTQLKASDPAASKRTQRKTRIGNLKRRNAYRDSIAKDNRKSKRGTYGGFGPGKTIDPRSPKGIKMDRQLPYNVSYQKKWEAKYGRKLPPRLTPRGTSKMPGTNSTRVVARKKQESSIYDELVKPSMQVKPKKLPIRKGLGGMGGTKATLEQVRRRAVEDKLPKYTGIKERWVPKAKPSSRRQARWYGHSRRIERTTPEPGRFKHPQRLGRKKTESFRNIKYKKPKTWAERTQRAGFAAGMGRIMFPLLSIADDNVRDYIKTKRLDLDPKPAHRAKEKEAAVAQKDWRHGRLKSQRNAARKKQESSIYDELVKPSMQVKPKKLPDTEKFKPTTSAGPMGSMPKQKKDPFRPVKNVHKSLDVLQDCPDKEMVMEKSRRLQLEFLRQRVWN